MSSVNDAFEELRLWARRADFAGPLPWGEIEDRILLAPAPRAEDLEAEFGDGGLLRRSLPWLLAAIPSSLIGGAPLIGLALAVMDTVYGRGLPSSLDAVVLGVFIMAIVLAAAPLLIWRTTRTRGAVGLATSLGAGVVSGGTAAVLALSSRIGVWEQAMWLAVAAALVGISAFVVLLVAGDAGPGHGRTDRFRASTPEERWRRALRAGVLAELRKRGLVGEGDSSRLLSLPPGSWKDVESRPDGRVVDRQTE